MTYEEYRQLFDAEGYIYTNIYKTLLNDYDGDTAAVLDYFKSQDYGLTEDSDGQTVYMVLVFMGHSDDDIIDYLISQGYTEDEAYDIHGGTISGGTSSGSGSGSGFLPPPSSGPPPSGPPPSGPPSSDSDDTDDNNTSNTTTPATVAQLLGSGNGCPQLLQLAGVDVAPPSKFTLTLNDIDGDSKRNEKGDMVRIVIASDKRSYSCEWKCITSEQKNVILQATSSKFNHATFSAQFFNEYDTIETATFYRGINVSIEPVLLIDGDKYYNVSFDIIEV